MGNPPPGGVLFSSTRGGSVPTEQIEQLQDKAQEELVLVRQRLEDALNQERRAMHCGLVKKRRELISDMVNNMPPSPKELTALIRSHFENHWPKIMLLLF